MFNLEVYYCLDYFLVISTLYPKIDEIFSVSCCATQFEPMPSMFFSRSFKLMMDFILYFSNSIVIMTSCCSMLNDTSIFVSEHLLMVLHIVCKRWDVDLCVVALGEDRVCALKLCTRKTSTYRLRANRKLDYAMIKTNPIYQLNKTDAQTYKCAEFLGVFDEHKKCTFHIGINQIRMDRP